MPSTAISAQGTIVQIASGTGSGKTITVIVVGYPTIITATSHGFANGDYVTIAGVTGADAALANLVWSISNVTTHTFSIPLNSIGKTLTATGTGTGATYTAIGNVKSISDMESGSASEIDVTNLASTAKEFRLGLVDNGSISLAMDHANADAGQVVLQARRLDGAAVNMKVILPSGTTPTASFSALVKKFSKSAAVDGVVGASCDIRINGAVTWA